MGDALSLAANISGIIGLGDVVFRRGKELYDLCSRCKNAPASKASLLEEIRASITVVAQCRIFLGEVENAAQESDDSLPGIRSILVSLGKEFDYLCDIILKSQVSARDGWFGYLYKNLRWTVEEPTIVHCCNKLHRLTSSMNMALSVAGRRHDLFVRREISVTKNEVSRLTDHIPKAIQSAIETTLQASMSNLLVASRSSDPSVPRVPELRRLAAPGSTKSRERFKTSRSKSGKVARRTGQKILPNPDFIIEESPSSIERIILTEHFDRSILLDSPVFNDVTVTLALMKTALLSALGTNKPVILSNHDAFFIGAVVDELLTEAHLASARRLGRVASQRRSQALLSPDVPIMGSEVVDFNLPWMKRLELRPPRLESKGQGVPYWNHGTTYFVLSQRFSKKTSWGVTRAHLIIGGDRTRSEVLLFSFDFVPKADLVDLGATVSFQSYRYMWLCWRMLRRSLDIRTPPDGQAWILRLRTKLMEVANLIYQALNIHSKIRSVSVCDNLEVIGVVLRHLMAGASTPMLLRWLSRMHVCVWRVGKPLSFQSLCDEGIRSYEIPNWLWTPESTRTFRALGKKLSLLDNVCSYLVDYFGLEGIQTIDSMTGTEFGVTLMYGLSRHDMSSSP